ncbi:tRNA pseudouridine(55) synthase TruB [Sphingomonas glaciei]|uniref:tRNA pseudouridine synthase B n=1 Tax=Sphingomonas glaciei TaxID=2938948 RepID=A0ABY5MYU3_9SPHN|nr:tRNA pseudouridine(55) synthase TruB [Sphingomonas glaciei]UUR09503.1 tRNA pseudouridine(55) synthase TruB [Sphingomonas glaciei]
MSGWIILDKPLGLGSTQAVSAVKRALREAGEAKTKVGHGGTLDPLATGVLPIALGEATKLAGRMLDAVKAYDFTVRFGSQTDTLDLEGKEIASSPIRPTLAEVAAALPAFTGPISQVPPAYSALKVDGQRAYDLARAGEEVELKSRAVTIHSLEIIGGKDGQLEEVTLSATVSKGTYIRSLACDVALALGTVGHVTMLRRTRAGPFALGQAISLDFLGDCAKARTLDGALLPLQAGLDDIPAFPVTPEEARLLRFGQRLSRVPRSGGLHLAVDGLTPVALVEGDRVVRGFNLQE